MTNEIGEKRMPPKVVVDQVSFDSIEVLKDRVDICKRAKHNVFSWDDVTTMKIGWVCKTCKKYWFIPIHKLKKKYEQGSASRIRGCTIK
jgi:hypothetical protein